MTWYDLGDMTRGHRSQYSDSESQFYLQPDVWECFEWFCAKEAPLIFLPLTYNGKAAKLAWPLVTDIKNPRYKSHRYWYGYQSLKVSRWSVIRCSYDEHLNFWCEITWRGLLTWPWVTWFWNFHQVCGKDVWTGVSKTAARSAAVFYIYFRKAWGECSNTPGPGAG